jgi:KDO2-lipid IV(A) lauroyltransferase
VIAKRVRHRLEYAAFNLVTVLFRVVPERGAVALAALLGWFAGSLLRIRRRAVDEHLALAFPNRPRTWRNRVARASYVHLAREWMATFRIERLSRDDILARTRMVGFDAFRAAVEEGKGVVLMTGHLGNWEFCAAGFTARGIALDAVAKSMANSQFGAALIEARERTGMGVIDVDDAPRRVLRSLRAGRVVAMLADQNAHRSGVFVPFFGKLASTARGPAVFALRTGAPMFLGIPLRNPGWKQEYTVELRRIEFQPSGQLDTDVLALTAVHTEALEQAIGEAPEQYFWQHKRWKKHPEGESL